MPTPARLTIAAAVAAVLTYWATFDLTGTDPGTTAAVWAILTAVAFGVVSVVTEVVD